MTGRLGAKHRRKTSASVSHLFVSQVVALTSSVLVTFVTAGILGPAGRGELAFMIGTANLVGVIGFGSLHVGATYAYKHGDRSAPRTGLLLATVPAVFLAIVAGGLLALHGLNLDIAGGRTLPLAAVSLGAGLVCINLCVLRTRQGLGDDRVFRNAWAIQSVIYLVVGTGLAYYTKSAYPVVGAFYLGIVASTAYGLVGFEWRRLAASKNIRSIIGRSIASHAAAIGTQMLYRVDIVALGIFSTASEVGFYSVATPIAELSWIVSETLSLGIFGRYRPQQTLEAHRALTRRFIRANLLAATVLALASAGTAALLIPVVLPSYTPSIVLIFMLLPGVLVQGASRVAISSITATGARRAPVLIGLTSAALSLLYVPFAIVAGARGVAVGSSVLYFVQGTIVLVLYRRGMKSR